MAIKYPAIDSYQIKRKKYPLRVSLSIYKQQGKLHQNGNNLVTKKQVSKTEWNPSVVLFYLSAHHTLPPDVHSRLI